MRLGQNEQKMKRGIPILFLVLGFFVVLLFPRSSQAGIFEIGAGFSFFKRVYGEDSFTWSRSYNASLAYHFTQLSGIEVSYLNTTERTKVESYQDTVNYDQVLSATWVQHLTGRQARVLPYFKVGAGQLYRKVDGSYADGSRPPRKIASLTGVFALGLKIKVTERLSFRAEGVTYLSGFSISTWEDNAGVTLGLSLYL